MLQLRLKIAGQVRQCPNCGIEFVAPYASVLADTGKRVIQLSGIEQTERQQGLTIAPDDPRHFSAKFEAEFVRLKLAIEEVADKVHLDSTLSEWLEPEDDWIPYKFLTWRVRRILNTPYQSFALSWATEPRLAKFVELMGRVENTVLSLTGASDEMETTGHIRQFECDAYDRQLEVSGKSWRTWCESIELHDLGATTLGALATSLEDLPGSFWNLPLREFTSKTYLELSETRGLGARKMSLVVDLFRNLATQLDRLPQTTWLGVMLLPKPICDLSKWLYEVLKERRVPTIDELGLSFCRPLLRQLETDLSPDVAAIVVRRLGFDQNPETLEKIAKDVGLTRERVRQLTQRATKVLHVRWPQGKHLLDDLYELLRSAPDAQRQVVLVRTILDRCFDVDFAVGGSRDEVIEAFRAAGRKRLTPMTEEDFVAWAATRFRRITPDTAFSWISAVAMTWSDSTARLHYFSDDPWDTLLLMLLSQREPLTLAEAAQLLETDERSVAGRVSRDLGLMEVDDKKIQAAHFCGVNRVDGEWRIDLAVPTSTSSPSVASISVDSLIEIVVAGLLQADIADATVWGVHRYANQMLESVYNGRLPAELTPFALQEVLASHSDGLIRRMRRRRLRWDADHTIPARGKIGWISYVSRRSGIPMTIDEMQKELRKFYQDYEPYVLQQLSLDDEDGDASLGVSLFGGIPHRVPPLIVPDDWELDCSAENVSEQLKLIASKIVDIGRRKGFPRSELRDLPWMIALANHYSFGKMNWFDKDDNGRNFTSRRTLAEKEWDGEEPVEVVEETTDSQAETNAEGASDGSNLNSIVEQLDGLL